MKIKVSELKRLIENLVSEAEKPSEEGNDSLDNQVDKFLAGYETEAKTSKVENIDFRLLTRRFLSEAEGDDGEPTGTVMELGLDELDVESFANSVVRLIDNFDSLLEVRNTLFRRAKRFLGKTYSDEVVKSFEQLMRENHGVEDGESAGEHAAEEFKAPPADRAGEGGGGGGAGA